jgi:hypothetical protein
MENSMQEVQTNKAEKMVPIDTSGESIDIEVKEDKIDSVKETSTDTPVVEVQETSTDTPVVENKEEELEEYSVGVKKRIDKLTKKMREAERREQAAIEYAKKIQVENKNLKSFTNVTSKERIASDEERLTSNESLLKASLQQAVENSDVEKQVLAQQELAKLAIEQERLKIRKQKQAQAEAVKEEPENEQPWENTQNQQNQQAQPDPKAQEWAEKNKWFGNDKPMTYTAMSFHDEIVSEGFDVTSDEYYNEIDKRIRKEFPHKFSDGGEASRPKQKVASAVRTSSTGRRTVRLTPSQVAIAKKLGVPLEEYAKHVKEA